ncbi:DNA uptake protein ComE-like DNA-binding protein [Christiangramia gaetbulicola]|uniref:DNA uptake protein ComE-like DNA-binding protein n=1 Tax=Christiangramia gaetbulicola TaxID=703340 RepID=A0A2T6AEL7_9FLAO|nr:helix-hairpin-helix domain-containing protein [Christiangramia gaetbulicola]PTX42264.1 DNA uptake protein ComE-like DNA-binding protein [Christiangramia gaetbulicola]
MKFLKSHFALSRSQQNGIFVLVLLIIILQAVLIFDLFISDSEYEVPKDQQAQIESFQKELDSLNRSSKKLKKDTIYPFNPNFLTDFKGYQLGLNVEEIDRFLEYRSQGKWVNSAEKFQEVTGVSDILLAKISPSFRFPEWTKKETTASPNQKIVPAEVKITDLNIASAEDLKTVNGIGEVLSERIVKYRTSIGGFVDVVQLKDIYGLSPEVIERVEQKFQILTRPDVTIKNINSISSSELAEIPYFNAALAKEIISYRNLHEGISSFDELIKIKGFPSDKIDRIKLYLAIE